MAEDTRQALSDPGVYRFYCVELDRKMIGRLVVSKSRDEDKPDAGEIAAMYLAGEYWDKGYGLKIMRNAALSLMAQRKRSMLISRLSIKDIHEFYQ